MRFSDDDLIGGLIWHFECKKYALSQIMAFTPPADGFQMRMAHSQYVTNLLSAIDLVREVTQDARLETEIQKALVAATHPNGQDNFGYLREMRNGIVHRSLDPMDTGEVVDGAVCAVATTVIPSRSGRAAYRPFARLLRNMFAICEDVIGPAIWAAIQTRPLIANPRTKEDLEQAFVAELAASTHVPAQVKAMADQFVGQMPFEKIATDRVERLKSLLLSGAPRGLAVKETP